MCFWVYSRLCELSVEGERGGGGGYSLKRPDSFLFREVNEFLQKKFSFLFFSFFGGPREKGLSFLTVLGFL